MRPFVRCCLAALLLAACHPKSPKVYDPAQVDFKARYNAIFEGQFYPSLVLGLAHGQSERAADSNALFSVAATAPANNAVLRITIDSSNLNYVTIFQEVMPKRGERYTFYPSIKWKFENLYRLRQQGVTDLTFTCFINDEEVDVENIRLNFRSANDCLLSVRDASGLHDFRWLFAAYVNEEHPYIDSILSGMLRLDVINRISGYQMNEKHVTAQVEALWHYALERGITYSSISCTSTPTQRSNVQHIRFFDEVYNSRQANCIDACVFFASVMRKIGLKPVIFVEPCHAYLGYYTDKNRRHLSLLETTITGWVDFPALERSLRSNGRLTDAQYERIGKYLTADQKRQWEGGKMTFDELKQTIAHTLFERASAYDRETYEKNKQYFLDPENTQYQMLDIELLRKQVQPISE